MPLPAIRAILALPLSVKTAIQDYNMWAGAFPDTDEMLQSILDEIARRNASDSQKGYYSEDEAEFDLPQPWLNGSTKYSSDTDYVLDVSEHYFVDIGEVINDGDKALSAIFRDKRNPDPGVGPMKHTERNVEGLRELLRWVQKHAQNIRAKGVCKCGRLQIIGTEFCAKHCLQAVAKQ